MWSTGSPRRFEARDRGGVDFAEAVETAEEEIDSETVLDRAVELVTRLARQFGLDVDGVSEPTG